jgi:hypothetical protein
MKTHCIHLRHNIYSGKRRSNVDKYYSTLMFSCFKTFSDTWTNKTGTFSENIPHLSVPHGTAKITVYKFNHYTISKVNSKMEG